MLLDLSFTMKLASFILIFSIAFLAFASSQSSRTVSSSTSKKRMTQHELYMKRMNEEIKRLNDAYENKFYNLVSTNLIYKSPAVKKLGIKPPPRNRLKSDSFVSGNERDRAKFLNKQDSRHREIVSRLVNLSQYYSVKSLVSDLNRVSTSFAWKRLANSNTNPLFAGEEKRFRDEISYGLSSVDGSLRNLEYRVTHNGAPNTIVRVFDDSSSDLPAGWQLLPADRRQRKMNWRLMQSENAAARDQYIQNHPEDSQANNFIPPKAMGADGHIIDNPDLPPCPVDP